MEDGPSPIKKKLTIKKIKQEIKPETKVNLPKSNLHSAKKKPDIAKIAALAMPKLADKSPAEKAKVKIKKIVSRSKNTNIHTMVKAQSNPKESIKPLIVGKTIEVIKVRTHKPSISGLPSEKVKEEVIELKREPTDNSEDFAVVDNDEGGTNAILITENNLRDKSQALSEETEVFDEENHKMQLLCTLHNTIEFT